MVIHCCSQATGDIRATVDVQSIRSAIAIAEYFKSHNMKIHGILDEGNKDKMVRAVLNWLDKHGKMEITPRDIYTGKVAGCTTAQQAVELLDLLQILGYGLYATSSKTFILF